MNRDVMLRDDDADYDVYRRKLSPLQVLLRHLAWFVDYILHFGRKQDDGMVTMEMLDCHGDVINSLPAILAARNYQGTEV